MFNFIRYIFILTVIGLFATNAFIAYARDTATASKQGGVSTCDTSSSGTFTITPANTRIRWSAQRFDSPPCPTGPGAGNDFWLDRLDGGTQQDVPLTLSLSGFGAGELDLPPGNYQIPINLATMGSGNYSIEYNLTTAISLSPANASFTTLENSNSSAQTFSVASIGDLEVSIAQVQITGAEAGHFELIGGNPVGDSAPTSFQVRCTGDNSPGAKSATLTVTATSVAGTASDSTNLSCDVEALVPDIACLALTDFGDADQTIPETITGNVEIENSGTAPLSIAAPVFTASTSPAFSFAGVSGAATIAPGNALNVPITFDSTGASQDQIFSGALRITSNDPDESPKECPFTARAHEPRPVMLVEPAGVLDFREVELGFAFTKPIIVSNLGDATLQVTVSDAATPADSPDQWSLREAGTRNIPPGADAEIFRQTCEPDAEGAFTMTMRVSGNDPVNPTETVTMTCDGIPPVPIDAVLVLDRSGSMDARLGDATAARKIEAMQRAASLFADLLNLRAESLSDAEADKIGLVRYNHVNDVYWPLDLAKGSHFDTLINTSLAPAAVADAARLLPDDATGIGGAMETAAGLLVGSPASRKHVMVLLTDGIENRAPTIAEVQPGILAADPELDIYSVGLGTDGVIDSEKLQSITNAGTDGFHQVDEDLSGLGRFKLENFYFKIFSDAADLALAVDPTFYVDLTSDDAEIVDTARITSSDKSAYFLSLDAPEYRPFYDLELVSPQGDVMQIGAQIGGVPVQIKERNTYRVFRVVFPDLAQSHTYIGTWKLQIRPNGKCAPRPDQKDPDDGVRKPCQSFAMAKAPIGFATAVASNYKLDVATTPDDFNSGAEILLTARLSDRGWPAVDGDVFVDVRNPAGLEQVRLKMFDDGSHGDVDAGDGVWTRRFVDTSLLGTYRFYFKAFGKNERGELAPREATRYVTLSDPTRPQTPCGVDCTETCIPCLLQKWLWAIAIAMLLLLLMCCYRKRLFG